MYDGISKEEVDEYLLTHDRDDYEKKIVSDQRRKFAGVAGLATLVGTGGVALGGGDAGIPLAIGGLVTAGSALKGNKVGKERAKRIRSLAENKPLYEQVFKSKYPVSMAPNGKFKYIYKNYK